MRTVPSPAGVVAGVIAATGLALACGGPPEDESAPSEASSESAGEPAPAPRVEAADIDAALEAGALLLDVRTSEELAEHGTLEGFVHIPITELEGRIGELPTGVPILTA